MTVKKIWFEDESYIEVGSVRDNTGIVKEIREHSAQGEGDKWFWEVVYSDGEISRFFNVDSVDYQKETK